MPDNNTETKDSYTLVLDRLEAMEKQYDALAKKYDEVTAFNKVLLERKEIKINTKTEDEKFVDAAKEKFAKMLKGE